MNLALFMHPLAVDAFLCIFPSEASVLRRAHSDSHHFETAIQMSLAASMELLSSKPQQAKESRSLLRQQWGQTDVQIFTLPYSVCEQLLHAPCEYVMGAVY